MKGPGGRHRHPIRRLWQCPLCQRREWTGGDVVTRRCRCRPDAPEQPWMRLVEDPPRRREATPPERAAPPARAEDAGS